MYKNQMVEKYMFYLKTKLSLTFFKKIKRILKKSKNNLNIKKALN